MNYVKYYFTLWKEAFRSERKYAISDLLIFMFGTLIIYLLIASLGYIFPEVDVIFSVASSAFTLIAMAPFISMIIKFLKS